MVGYEGEGSSGVFESGTLYPSSISNSGYWQINNTFLYLFGGWSPYLGMIITLLVFILIYVGTFNTLWQYDIPNNTWNWVGGGSTNGANPTSDSPYHRSFSGSGGDDSRYGYIFGGRICIPSLCNYYGEPIVVSFALFLMYVLKRMIFGDMTA
jgi:hypothetical protein